MITPSAYQTAIWDHFKNRPEHLVVEALAGSGKTTTIIEGLKYLPPGRRLLTSFGRDIVGELKERVPKSEAQAQTMHGLGMRAILSSFRGIKREPDHDKLGFHVTEALKAKSLTGTSKPTRQQVLDLCAAAKWSKDVMIQTPEEAAAVLRRFDMKIVIDGAFLSEPEAADILLNILMRCAYDQTRFDFDDMIWMPVVWGLNTGAFDQILIDELQDFSPAQIRFVERILLGGGRLTGIGDSHQAIYLFRAADSKSMQRVTATFNARTLPLSVTYRCPKAVVRAANKYVPGLQARSDAPEGLVQRMRIHELVDMAEPGDCIISRTNAPLARIGAELRMAGKPCFQLGRDQAKLLIDLIKRSKQTTTDGLRAWLSDYLARRGAEIQNDEHALEALKDRIETVKAFALGYSTTAEVVNYIRGVYSDEMQANSIILSTVHRMKGKERDRVYLIWSTFNRPRKSESEQIEERNLSYVAITRSKTELYYVDGNPFEL